jgi:hypothetical protein
MHLFELALSREFRGRSGVPEWALGCFRRRCITYFDGTCDASTQVVWLQSRGLTLDYRFPVVRDSDPVLRAEHTEAGAAHTRWDGTHMNWQDWSAFQTHARWPEPGRLTRVGDCLIEFAPSGAYVEDWRAQPPGTGPLIGLELVEERARDSGAVLHRGGALVVCGEHAGFVRGRTQPLPEGRIADFVAKNRGNAAALQAVFGFDASYARWNGDADVFRVELATNPEREGTSLLDLEGFDYDEATHSFVQVARENGRDLERRFTIDTLEPVFAPARGTEPSPEGRGWFERESGALLSLP